MIFEIAESLRSIRKSRGLTMEQVAKRAGTSMEYIHELETGKASPSMAMLGKLADVLHFDITLEPEEMETLPDRIRIFRTRKGLKQRDLARLTKISVASIRRYESGTFSPRTNELCRIAEALDCTPNDLLGFYDEDL